MACRASRVRYTPRLERVSVDDVVTRSKNTRGPSRGQLGNPRKVLLHLPPHGAAPARPTMDPSWQTEGWDPDAKPPSPPPSIGPLLDLLPLDVLTEVLRRLDPNARSLLRRASRGCRRLVEDSGLRRSGLRLLRTSPDVYGLQLWYFTQSIALVEWGRKNGIPWSRRLCFVAACQGNATSVLKHLRALGCPWDEDTSWALACEGDLDTLKWAHEQGCPWDERTCCWAARYGNLEVLEWLHGAGAPWDERTCMFAAAGGNLQTLQWAREHGCPWKERTLRSAYINEHHDVLRWAIDNECPGYQKDVYQVAMSMMP